MTLTLRDFAFCFGGLMVGTIVGVWATLGVKVRASLKSEAETRENE